MTSAFPFVVSIHDVAPATSDQITSWVDDLDARGVPATLLVIPGPYAGGPALPADRGLVTFLHEAAERGHEVSLHGFLHDCEPSAPSGPLWRQAVNQLLARGKGEFWALEEPAAHDLLRAGLDVLDGAGFEVTGFTPPGWLASPGSRRALAGLGFSYWTSQLAVHDLKRGTAMRMPALSHRPGAAGERLGAHVMTNAARAFSRTRRPFRIALHPADLGRPGLRQAAHAAIDAALAAGARPVTYETLVRGRANE